MRRLFLAVTVLLVAASCLVAGEYQTESAQFEKAFAAGKYELAATLAQTNVGKGNALNMLAYAAFKAGDFVKSSDLCKQAIAADPEQYWAHNTLGACLNKEGKYEEAIAEFKLSAEVNSKATDPDAEARVAKAQKNIEDTLVMQGK